MGIGLLLAAALAAATAVLVIRLLPARETGAAEAAGELALSPLPTS